jgi:uncharacterized damage-inducible protein DinB
MPTAATLDITAASFVRSTQMLAKFCSGLSDEDWSCRPIDSANCMQWIVGHMVWARSRAITLLGASWELPWLTLFARGTKPVDPAQYPAPAEMLAAWQDSAIALAAAIEDATEERLASPATQPSPSFDGTIGGMVSFLAFHEAYHVGQCAYLRRCLGHEGAAG